VTGFIGEVIDSVSLLKRWGDGTQGTGGGIHLDRQRVQPLNMKRKEESSRYR
jgi:hypothetical protein